MKISVIESYQHYTKKLLNKDIKKEIKTTGYIMPTMSTVPGMVRWKILMPGLICSFNQSNEYFITLIRVCISIMSQHPVK